MRSYQPRVRIDCSQQVAQSFQWSIEMEAIMEKPECKLLGENGNVFNLIGITKRTLRRAKLSDQLESFDTD